VNVNGSISGPLETLSSSDYRLVGDNVMTKRINVNFDFASRGYYLEIEIKRDVMADDPNLNVSVSLVRLMDVF
jgi:hypothetical protein